MPALTSGKYIVGLALKNGQYLKIGIDTGRITGGTISYPGGTTHKLTGPGMVKILGEVLKENIPNHTAPLDHKIVYNPQLGGTVAVSARDHGSVIGAASVQTVMDDYYGGLRGNTSQSVSPQEIVQNLYTLLTLNRNYPTRGTPPIVAGPPMVPTNFVADSPHGVFGTNPNHIGMVSDSPHGVVVGGNMINGNLKLLEDSQRRMRVVRPQDQYRRTVDQVNAKRAQEQANAQRLHESIGPIRFTPTTFDTSYDFRDSVGKGVISALKLGGLAGQLAYLKSDGSGNIDVGITLNVTDAEMLAGGLSPEKLDALNAVRSLLSRELEKSSASNPLNPKRLAVLKALSNNEITIQNRRFGSKKIRVF